VSEDVSTSKETERERDRHALGSESNPLVALEYELEHTRKL
jgi:hypothetical protein